MSPYVGGVLQMHTLIYDVEAWWIVRAGQAGVEVETGADYVVGVF
jgi:hypothetical protein